MSTDFKRKLNHEIPVNQSDIVYQIINTKKYKPDLLGDDEYDEIFTKIIRAAKQEVEAKYHTQFTSDVTEYEDEKIHYYLFGLIDPSHIDSQLISQLKKAKSRPNSRVNLAMIFSIEEQQKATEVITSIDNELGVNTVYQDTHLKINGRKYLTISAVDAADNMVCETFRVKYRTIHKTDLQSLDKLAQARDEVWHDVLQMQSIYEKYQLWHRSPYDGAFMFRTKYGWLTTATCTPKNNVTRQDMSLILDFDEINETITYAGDRLPSSDLPEFLVLVERNEEALRDEGQQAPIIKYMAHFHKNEITRNPNFANYAVPFYRYGVSESGHEFANEILKNGKAADGVNIHGKGRGFIILEHGVVRMGVKLSHLEEFLGNLIFEPLLLRKS